MFTPTEEQNAITAAACETNDNLIITAYAGAAKTSTLILIAEVLPKANILCLAFNKAIATEMEERLPHNCKSLTLSSLGMRAWRGACAHKLSVDKSKVYRLTKDYLDSLEDENIKSELYEDFSDLMRTVQFGASCGYIPSGEFRAKGLMDDEEFFGHTEKKLNEDERELVRQVTITGIREALKGNISFDDMLFMPTLFGASWPRYDVVLVDEAQDLSALNHYMLQKITKRGVRLIAVGDECQAIYGFRGAHEESMQLLKQTFDMKELKLTISFRCPSLIVKEAQWRAPDMKAPEWAKVGNIIRPKSFNPEDFAENAAIICRNNAPLFRLAINLLAAGRRPVLRGNEVIDGLVKILNKWKPRKNDWPDQKTVLEKIDAWEKTNLKKVRAKGAIRDRAQCLRIFAYQGEDLNEIIQYALHIKNLRGSIQLMTGHKSKGLEFDDVYILDEHLLKPEGQDLNLRYVMQTRTKQNLTYITTEIITNLAEEYEDNETA